MARYRTNLDTAPALSITTPQANSNRVMRVGALSLGRSKKAAKGRCYFSQVANRLPAKVNPAKSLTSSNWSGISGVTRSTCRLVDGSRYIRDFKSRLETVIIWTTQLIGGDVGWPPIQKGHRGKRNPRCQPSRLPLVGVTNTGLQIRPKFT
jgi:hypothetical protein